jgi:hypothetical protein
MLVFVVPLKSRRVARSWRHVTHLCERTLKSICGQTSPQFRAIVVCHERPEIDFRHPAISYVSVDFPLPDFNDHGQLNRDQCRKLAAGFLAAAEFHPTHVMPVDADDCVSNRLAEWVEHHPVSPGWFFDTGFIYREGSRRIYRKREDFYHWCGTSHIVRYDLLRLPRSDELLTINVRTFSHFVLKEKIAAGSGPPAALPFPGAVYVNTRGDEATHSRAMVAWALKRRPIWLLHYAELTILQRLKSEPLTPELQAEFNLYPAGGETGMKGTAGKSARICCL